MLRGSEAALERSISLSSLYLFTRTSKELSQLDRTSLLFGHTVKLARGRSQPG